MLGTVASTAAGVVAGSFLFQGISHLLNGHGSQHPDSGIPHGLFDDSADRRGNLDDFAADNSGVMDTSALDDLTASDFVSDDSESYV
jgi:hypothetical protein